MPVFWVLFWFGFIGFILIALLAPKLLSGGYETDASHVWMYEGTRNKARNANVREVWQQQNPGKSWKQHQRDEYSIIVISLAIVFIGFLIWLANKIFQLPVDNVQQRLFWQVGAPILGVLSASVFFGLQKSSFKTKSKLVRILHISALAVMFLMLAGALAMTLLKQNLPISPHWIWVPAGASIVLILLDNLFRGGKEKSASRGGASLEKWAQTVYSYGRRYEFVHDNESFGEAMQTAVSLMKHGVLDNLSKDKKFFRETEQVMLDLAGGKPLSISNPEIFRGRNDVIRTLQEFYFYSVQKFDYEVHPKIKAAIKK